MEGIVKFLGVSSGTSSRGPYYNIEFYLNQASIRCRCTAEVFETGMRIPFGADVTIKLGLRMYQGSCIIQVTGIEE